MINTCSSYAIKSGFSKSSTTSSCLTAALKNCAVPINISAVKAAQEHVKRREGGIIWHTQGSGKSLVMVWLAKWILENNPNARVVIITDRDELDKQIERVFTEVGESMVRTTQR